MKRVPCGNPRCGDRRAHHAQPDVMRPHRMVEVPDDFADEGEMFCSIACACEAGAYDVKTGFIKKEDRRTE